MFIIENILHNYYNDPNCTTMNDSLKKALFQEISYTSIHTISKKNIWVVQEFNKLKQAAENVLKQTNKQKKINKIPAASWLMLQWSPPVCVFFILSSVASRFRA